MPEVLLRGLGAGLAAELTRLLRATGYTLAPDAPEPACATPPDAILADLRGTFSLADLSRLRGSWPTAPLIALAATDSALADALTQGASDGLVAPIQADLIARRVDAAVHHWRALGPTLILADRQVDLEAGEVILDDQRVGLSPTEAALLRHLAENAGRAVRQAELLTRVFGYRAGVASRTVATTVQRLRGKIEVNPRDPQIVQSIYGVGYRFVDPAPPPPPEPPAPFFGRTAERTRLGDLLAGEARLLTVLGAGGAGKTRLVQALLPWTGGPSWFCDWSGARSRDEALRAVAAALGTPLPHEAPARALAATLRGRGRALLVLDNAEQLVEVISADLREILCETDKLSLLVTSRVPLGLDGELCFRLDPLPLPTGDAPDALRDSPAVALFVDRLRRAQPDFSLSDGNAPRVAAIARALDGLPLALELAAARADRLSLAEIQAGLSARFSLLVGGPAASPRHASLRAALDWSWSLLRPWEQAALAQLSVFVGGFDREAAAAVLDLSGWVEAPWTLDVLDGLVARSLVRGAAGDSGARYGLLDSIAAYAAERLGGAARAEAELRHGQHYAELGSWDTLRAVESFGGAAIIQALSAEIGNTEAATRRAVARGDAAVASAAVRAAARALGRLGPISVAHALCDEVLGLALDPLDRIMLLVRRADLRGLLGDLAGSEADGREALRLAQDHPLRGLVLTPIMQLGETLTRQGRHAEALAALRGGLALGVASPHDEAQLRGLVGESLVNAGRLEEARVELESGWRSHRSRGARRPEAEALARLGAVHEALGEPDEARTRFEAALATAEEVDHRRYMASILGRLGWLEGERGRWREGEAQLQRASALHRDLGQPDEARGAQAALAWLTLGQGRALQAEALLPAPGAAGPAGAWAAFVAAAVEAALRPGLAALRRLDLARALAQETGEDRLETLILRESAELWLALGEPSRGLAVLGAAPARPEARWRVEDAGLVALRAFLGDADGSEASRALRRLGALPELALHTAREAARAGRRGEQAQPLLREARRLADALGLAPGARARVALDRVSPRP